MNRAVPRTHVTGVARFERLFRAAAGLDVDKEDLKRYSDFVNHKVYDLLVRGEAVAKANGRDLIEPIDLPITKGLQEDIRAFKEIDEQIELAPILDHLTARPPLDLVNSEETEAQLPVIVGGLSVALARAFKIIDPDLKNPQTKHWHFSSSTCCCRSGRLRGAALQFCIASVATPGPTLMITKAREKLRKLTNVMAGLGVATHL